MLASGRIWSAAVARDSRRDVQIGGEVHGFPESPAGGAERVSWD